MKLSVKRIDKGVSAPGLNSKDLIKLVLNSRRDVIVNGKEIHTVYANVVLGIPKGYVLVIGLTQNLVKKGLVLPEGTIFLESGQSLEELCFSVFNSGKDRAAVLKGENIAYGILVKAEKIEVSEVK